MGMSVQSQLATPRLVRGGTVYQQLILDKMLTFGKTSTSFCLLSLNAFLVELTHHQQRLQ